MSAVRLLAAAMGLYLTAVSWALAAPPITLRDRGTASELSPVELFDGIESGQLQVTYRPRSERSAHVQIRNVSDQPLNVRLPDTFGARPILAQFFPSTSSSSSQQQPQSVGGPFSNRTSFQGNGGGNNQNGNFFNQFNIAPERHVSFDVQTVCLDHGSPTPTTGMRYELVPLDTVLIDAEPIRQTLIEMRDGKLTQREAQAAAWHLSERSGNLTWDKLGKIKGQQTTTGWHPFFSPRDLTRAKEAVARVQQDRPIITRKDEKPAAIAKPGGRS